MPSAQMLRGKERKASCLQRARTGEIAFRQYSYQSRADNGTNAGTENISS